MAKDRMEKHLQAVVTGAHAGTVERGGRMRLQEPKWQ